MEAITRDRERCDWLFFLSFRSVVDLFLYVQFLLGCSSIAVAIPASFSVFFFLYFISFYFYQPRSWRRGSGWGLEPSCRFAVFNSIVNYSFHLDNHLHCFILFFSYIHHRPLACHQFPILPSSVAAISTAVLNFPYHHHRHRYRYYYHHHHPYPLHFIFPFILSTHTHRIHPKCASSPSPSSWPSCPSSTHIPLSLRAHSGCGLDSLSSFLWYDYHCFLSLLSFHLAIILITRCRSFSDSRRA